MKKGIMVLVLLCLCSAPLAYSQKLTPEEQASSFLEEIQKCLDLEMDMIKRMFIDPHAFIILSIDDEVEFIFDLETRNVWLSYVTCGGCFGKDDRRHKLLGKSIGRLIWIRDRLWDNAFRLPVLENAPPSK